MIRAITLAALAPRRGERLWDIGSGLRLHRHRVDAPHPTTAPSAIERDPARAARARRNAMPPSARPGLSHRRRRGPHLPSPPCRPPDAVFLGAAAHTPRHHRSFAWSALRPRRPPRRQRHRASPPNRALARSSSPGSAAPSRRIAVERLDAGRHPARLSPGHDRHAVARGETRNDRRRDRLPPGRARVRHPSPPSRLQPRRARVRPVHPLPSPPPPFKRDEPGLARSRRPHSALPLHWIDERRHGRHAAPLPNPFPRRPGRDRPRLHRRGRGTGRQPAPPLLALPRGPTATATCAIAGAA